jgi:hypothetical protein
MTVSFDACCGICVSIVAFLTVQEIQINQFKISVA